MWTSREENQNRGWNREEKFKRFAYLNLEEIEKIKHEKDSENTHKATGMAYNVFKIIVKRKTLKLTRLTRET